MKAFKCMDSMFQDDAHAVAEINRKILIGWKNWRKQTGIIYRKKLGIQLKGKLYKSVMRPALLYGMKTMHLTKAVAVVVQFLSGIVSFA